MKSRPDRRRHAPFDQLIRNRGAAVLASRCEDVTATRISLRQKGTIMPDRGCRMSRVYCYVERNIGTPITITAMADEACMSVHHFARTFKTQTGKTPRKYILDARITCAKRRLDDGETIADVAFSCGFSSQSHMTSAFRANTGITPGEFRRRGQADRIEARREASAGSSPGAGPSTRTQRPRQ